MLNKRYLPTAKNKGVPEECPTELVKYIAVPCGWCSECRKKKRNDWTLRLLQESQVNRMSNLLTMTIDEESMSELIDEIGVDDGRKIALIAVRRWRERVRRKTGKSPRHWFVAETGENGTKRIHIHGYVINCDVKTCIEMWGYGNVHEGYSHTDRSIRYACKYLVKDEKPIIMTSPGIGKSWIDSSEAGFNSYNYEDTKTTITMNLYEYSIPNYWKAKIWSEKQRLCIWLNMILKWEKRVGTKIFKLEGWDVRSIEGWPRADPEVLKDWMRARDHARVSDERLGLKPVEPLGRAARRREVFRSAQEKRIEELLKGGGIHYEFEKSLIHKEGGLWRKYTNETKITEYNTLGRVFKPLEAMSVEKFNKIVENAKKTVALRTTIKTYKP